MTGNLWDIIVPKETTNLVTNPSTEVNTAGYAALGAGGGILIVRVLTEKRRGAACLRTIPLASPFTTMVAFAVPEMVIGKSFSVSVDIKATVGDVLLVAIADSTGTIFGSSAITATGEWQRGDTSLSIVSGTAPFFVAVRQDLVSSAPFFTDGWQCEEVTILRPTTYIDGDQDGGVWLGTAHASKSFRSEGFRKGGHIFSFEELGLKNTNYTGVGMPPVDNRTSRTATQDGAVLEAQNVESRVMTVSGYIQTNNPDTSLEREQFHALRREVLDSVKPRAKKRRDPFLLRYRGNVIDLETCMVYEGGLDWKRVPANSELPIIRMLGTDPYFRHIGNNAQLLNTPVSTAFGFFSGRIEGDWTIVQPPSAGTIDSLKDIKIHPITGEVYFVGNFTNWDGNADSDGVARWNPVDLYRNVGTPPILALGMSDLVFTANGDLYTIGIGSSTVQKFDGVSWTTLGTFNAGLLLTLTLDLQGKLVVAGSFLDVDSVADTLNIARFNFATSFWEAMGTGIDAPVQKVVASKVNGSVFAGIRGDATLSGLQEFPADGSGWVQVGVGVGDDSFEFINALTIDDGGSVYFGGIFEDDASGNTIFQNFGVWNGSKITPIDSEFVQEVFGLLALINGSIIISGRTGVIGDNARIKIYNGFSFSDFDVQLPTDSSVLGLAETTLGDLFIGYNKTGTAIIYSNLTIVTALGNAFNYPWLRIKREGGDSATIKLVQNVTANRFLFFDYSLLDGEEVLIDLRPRRQSMSSSIFGNNWKILPQSDDDDFFLLEGENEIVFNIVVSGSPTITANIYWRDTFWSID